MSDPISITAGVIAVAGFAYTSSRALYKLISTIRGAPQVLQDLIQYIEALSHILKALKTNLDGRGARLSESQITYLREAKPTLEGCDLACRDFGTTIHRFTTLSQDGRMRSVDGIKLNSHSKIIADFLRVVYWKESLAHVLDVTSPTSLAANMEAFKWLEVKTAAGEFRITSDLKVVNTRLEKLLASEPESEEDLQIVTHKRGVEEQQKTALVQYLSLCQAAADGETQTTGHSFRNNKVFGEARATYGNVGHVSAGSANHSYDSNSASDKAKVVMGNIDVASFLEFMK